MNFLNPQNLSNIVNVFKDYMKDKYNVDLESDGNLRTITWRQMQIVSANSKGSLKLQDLNIQVLGVLRKSYLERLTRPQKLRDVEVFGNRRVTYNESLPMEARVHTDVSKRMEAVQQQRQAEFQVTPQRPPQIDPSPKEDPENIDDFIAKVKNFERERSQSILMPPAPTNTPPPMTTAKTSIIQEEFLPHPPSTTFISPPAPKEVVVFRSPSATQDIVPGEYSLQAFSLKMALSDFQMIASLKVNEQTIPLKLLQHIVLTDQTGVVVHAIYEPFVPQTAFHVTVEKALTVALNEQTVDNYTMVASISLSQ